MPRYGSHQLVASKKEKLPAFSPGGGQNLFKNEETNQLFENDGGTVPYVRGKNSGYSRTPISLPPSKYEIRAKNMIIYEYPAIGRTIITIYPIDKLSPFKLYNESILFTLSNGHLSASNEQMLPSPEGFRQSFYQALEISPISMTFPGFPNKSEKSLLNNNSNEALLNISAQRRANLENAFKNGGGPAAAGGGGSRRTQKRKNRRNSTRKN